jgi:ribosomal protein S12 methylthiotransferase accessory factor
LLPADLCLRRPPDQREIEPPLPLSTGSAAGTSWHAAALHGMLELIERDAASLWWRGGSRGGAIPPQHEAHIMAEALLPRLRQNATGRRSWLLDITTGIGVPCVAAVSCSANGFGFASALLRGRHSRLPPAPPLWKCVNSKWALAVVDAKRRERGEAALNERGRGHRRRATMIDAGRCPLLQPVPERKQHLAIEATDPGAVLQLMGDRPGQFGIETFGLNLTRAQLAVPVARVIAPGLQPEPSEIIPLRLADMITQTGGGMKYTGGVALI